MSRQYGRIAAWGLTLLLGHAVPGTSSWAEDPAPVLKARDFSAAPAYEVVRVIDGDTVVLLLDGTPTTTRLIGVDTPETVHPRTPVEAYGADASRFLDNLLVGESVYLGFEPGSTSLDKYGRTLAYLYRVPDGLFVNLEIVRQGYGHAYTVYPFQYMEVFRFYEHKAMQSGRGLWGPRGDSKVEVATPAIDPTTQQPRQDQQAGNDVVVYATRSGATYHAASCRSLAKSKIPLTLKAAKERGLEPCSTCQPPQ